MANRNEPSEWVSLRRAAEILGVHPATVRNWADSGKLPYRRTAGKHRRFNVNELTDYLDAQGDIQPVELQIIIQNALGQTRMQVGSEGLETAPWYQAMSDEGKGHLREQGRRVLEALRRFVAAGAPSSGLASAITLGKDYAAYLIDDGLTLPQAMRGFYFFSDFVLNSILTWSELSPPKSSTEWSTLLRQVNTYMNAIQLSIVEYYEEG
ncbi:MAG: helix-turn-helix domain-containing protein [Chloroflexota bacterium]|nr:helix-turn-helix domain-containing protein [Chloroflexota bacterium]MDE2909253.1 helix-turn-helix domain-containing protein [Chloroflexota bacterium]